MGSEKRKIRLVIPPECQAGAHNYKIAFSDKALQIADIRAQVDHASQIIRLSRYGTNVTTRTIPRSVTVLFESFLHELLHIHNHLWCGGDLTEQLIEAISAGLSQSLLSLGIEPDFSEIPEEEL